MALSADNKAIKIPIKHYCGFAKREDDGIPLGFLTPDGTDKAAEKRKATVDSWSGNKTGVTFDNKPLSGFKLGKNVRHGGYGWGGGNVKWRIEDPRGFELEISSPNFAQILGCTTIENGEILEKCIWGRLGQDNVLLPISSDVYKAAAANTERMAKSASKKDLKLGCHVIFQNGDEGRYLGQFFLVQEESYHAHALTLSDKKVFIVELTRPVGNDEDEPRTYFHCVSNPKISEIKDGEAITLEDAERYINNAVSHDKASLDGYSYSIHNCKGVSATKNFTVTYDLEKHTDYASAKVKATQGRPYGSDAILGELTDGQWGIFSETHSGTVEMFLILKNSLDNDRKIDYVTTANSYYGRAYPRKVTMTIPLDSVHWYLSRAVFKTSAGFENTVYF